jgi:hypothetical protein
MTRSLKSLGLLVGAMLVLCGLMAQAASAHVPARFTSEQNTTTITGETDPGTVSKFVVTGQTVECGIERYHGHVVGTSVETVTVTPTYTECTAFGFLNAKVTGFGHYPASEGAGPYCDYRLRADGFADIECPVGKDITVEASTCTVHVPAQTELGTTTENTKHPGIIYTTGRKVVTHLVPDITTEKHDLTLDIHFTDITATHTDGFACPLTSTGEATVATLDARITAWGEDPESGALVGITWDATTA